MGVGVGLVLTLLIVTRLKIFLGLKGSFEAVLDFAIFWEFFGQRHDSNASINYALVGSKRYCWH